MCFSKKKTSVGQISSAEESDSDDESSGRVVVGNVGSSNICAKVLAKGLLDGAKAEQINLATDTGISKTVLNRIDWMKVREGCKFVKTSKRFRPYGTHYHLPIKGRAQVYLFAENGAQIQAWMYINDDPKEPSLLGEKDARRLGIVTIDLKGASSEVSIDEEYEEQVRKITYGWKTSPGDGVISG